MSYLDKAWEMCPFFSRNSDTFRGRIGAISRTHRKKNIQSSQVSIVFLCYCYKNLRLLLIVELAPRLSDRFVARFDKIASLYRIAVVDANVLIKSCKDRDPRHSQGFYFYLFWALLHTHDYYTLNTIFILLGINQYKKILQ